MAEYIELDTKCGKIRGIANEGSYEFRSIKYANAKRWEYPEEITTWNGVYDATEYKECSYQRRSFEDDAQCNSFYHKEFREGMTFKYGEDCQFLNILAPKNADNSPVLLYIHGGSFTGGSDNEAHISGEEFVKDNVIFVSINYRLGPFGFCSHPDLKNDEGICGNYGLYDQYIAIKWIKDNIASFGGDSEKITLMGQSAGAMSVDIHTTSPLEKGWFAGAVLCSGAALQRFLLKPMDINKTRKFWDKIIQDAGVKDINELKSVDAKTLFYAWNKECNASILSMPYTFPVYDGKLLRKSDFKKKNLYDMPYVIGMTVNDMLTYFLMRIIKKWTYICEKQNKNKCYPYLFDRALPGDNKGAWHAADLLYFFSTLKNNWRPFEKIDYEIAKQTSDVLVAFCKTQDPNCPSIPEWAPDPNKPMTFCEKTEQKAWNVKELIKNTIKSGFSI